MSSWRRRARRGSTTCPSFSAWLHVLLRGTLAIAIGLRSIARHQDERAPCGFRMGSFCRHVVRDALPRFSGRGSGGKGHLTAPRLVSLTPRGQTAASPARKTNAIWSRKAADLRLRLAQHNLGVLYARRRLEEAVYSKSQDINPCPPSLRWFTAIPIF